MAKWAIYFLVAQMLFAGKVVAEKPSEEEEYRPTYQSTEKWTSQKKMVVGGGAIVAGIAGLVALPFMAGFTATGVAAGSIAAGKLYLIM